MTEARRKKKTGYCLTSLAAWWTRVEREEVKFMKGVVRENMIRDKKMIENVKVREKKENFVKKFFPTCANSPGGRQYITGVSPTRKRAMEKIQNDEDIRTSAKTKLSNNIHFGLGQTKVKKEPVIRLFGSTDETTPINNIQPITGGDKARDSRIKVNGC